MSDLRICRVCLSKDVKIYNMNEYNLKLYYEEIMNTIITHELSCCFCYECAALLYKFHKFKQKCHTGQDTLEELLRKGPITLDTISQVDRKSKYLLSTTVKTETEVITTVDTEEYFVENDFSEYEVKEENPFQDIKNEMENCDKQCNVEGNSDSDCSIEHFAVLYKETVLENPVQDVKKENEKQSVVEKNTINSTENLDTVIVLDKKKIVNNKLKTRPGVNKFKHEKVNEVQNNYDTVEVLDKEKVVNNKRKTKCDMNQSKHKKLNEVQNNIKCEKGDKKKGKLMFIDPKNWYVITLNEKHALDNFKLKAQDVKYLNAVFKCNSCYKAFSNKKVMDRHMELNHCESRGQIECNFCRRRYKSKRVIRQHLLDHYKQYKCLICNLTFQRISAANHNVYHSGVTIPCKQCKLVFRHRSTYYSHMRLCHRSEHVCALCGEAFISQQGLRQHRSLMHFKQHSKMNPQTCNENEDQNTYCERCDIKFETLTAYHEHFRQSVKHASNVKSQDDQEKVGTSDEASYFKGIKPFNRVKNSRTTECAVCHKSFPTQTRCWKHHKAEHKDIPVPRYAYEFPEICEICGVTVRDVSKHMSVHEKSTNKKYSCKICGRQFNYLANVYRHQRVHTGEKPFKCPLCDKRFTQKISMQLHHRTFHLKQPYPKRVRKKEKNLSLVTMSENVSGCLNDQKPTKKK